jgi:hypothetical protein
MMETDRRNKMISLRLSEVEYEALRAHYPSYGARNISDFARLAMQRVIGNSHAPDGATVAKIHELDDRLSAVEKDIALLLEREKAVQ